MTLEDTIRNVVVSGGKLQVEHIENGTRIVFSTEHDDYRSAVIMPSDSGHKIISFSYTDEKIKNPVYWLIRSAIKANTQLKVINYDDQENPESLFGSIIDPYSVMICSSKENMKNMIRDAMQIIREEWKPKE